MTILLVFGLLLLLPLAFYYVYLARRGLRAITRIVSIDTCPVRAIKEGPVEISGTIRARGRPIRAPSGRRVVYAEVKVEGYTHSGKNRELVHAETESRVVPAELVDDDGEKVQVDLANVEVLGKGTFIRGAPASLKPATTSWTRKVSPRARHLQITETHIPHDVRVVLSGRASVVDAKVEMADGDKGYRDGAPVEKRTFLVSGAEDEPVLVTEGTEARLLWQASWPVALLAACALIAFTFAGVLFAVIIA